MLGLRNQLTTQATINGSPAPVDYLVNVNSGLNFADLRGRLYIGGFPNVLRVKVNILAWHIKSRPKQIFRHSVSPGTCLKDSGQVRQTKEQVPLPMRNPSNYPRTPFSSNYIFIDPTCAYCTVGSYAWLSVRPSGLDQNSDWTIIHISEIIRASSLKLHHNV